MAHRILPFYNIDSAVGKFKPNKNDDVMLIQFFMKEIHAFNAPFTAGKPFPPKPLTVNGVADQNTFDWILAFQKVYKGTGLQVHADGIVDTATGFATTRSSISRSVYTVCLFNSTFEAQQPDHFAKLWEHPRIPASLATQLKIFIK